MDRTIVVELSPKGIKSLIAEMSDFQGWLLAKEAEFLDRVGARTVDIAESKLNEAVYDGVNDVKVSLERISNNNVKVTAEGQALAFIEYGTGVTYPDDHPNKPEGLSPRGTYGKGHGSRKTWTYYGEPGSNGKVIRESAKGQVVATHGNPANASMYNTYKQIVDEIPDIADEVFK